MIPIQVTRYAGCIEPSSATGSTNMTLTISKSQIVIPPRVQREAGFKLGDQIEVSAVRGTITIAVKPQAADDEYTPQQRRIIDAQLAKGLADVKAGRIHSFASAKEASAFIEASVAKKNKAKTPIASSDEN